MNNIDDFFTNILIIKEKIIFNYACDTLITMLCCQSSFFLPFLLLSNFYNNNDNMVICNHRDTNYKIIIKIIIENENIEINMETCLAIINMSNNQIIKDIKLNLYLNLTNNDNTGIIIWQTKT
jgi:hypothetical protein